MGIEEPDGSTPLLPNTPPPESESPHTPTGTALPPASSGCCPLVAGSNPTTCAIILLPTFDNAGASRLRLVERVRPENDEECGSQDSRTIQPWVSANVPR